MCGQETCGWGLDAEAAGPEVAMSTGVEFRLEVEYFMLEGDLLPNVAGPRLGAVW